MLQIYDKPTDYKPTDYKPTDYKPTDYKPTDYKPTNYKPEMKYPPLSQIQVKVFFLKHEDPYIAGFCRVF
jgi:hypothetical protein